MLKKTGVVIIGGGVQAIALALRLKAYYNYRDFIIVDAQPLLGNWKRGVVTQDLSVLRTSNAANLDPFQNGESLIRFEFDEHVRTGSLGRRTFVSDKTTEMRVSEPARVASFNRHAKSLIDKYELQAHVVSGWVTGVDYGDATFMTKVTTCDGFMNIISDNVVVASGLGKPWLPDGGPQSPRIVHSDAVDVRQTPRGKRICIVGGGLTAATLATRFAERNKVSLCTSSSVTVSQLEADPAWRPGEVLYKGFMGLSSWEERARQLHAARVGHGITPEVWDTLSAQVNDGAVFLREGIPVDMWKITPGGNIKVMALEDKLDMVIFATGYRTSLNETPFLAGLASGLKNTWGLPHVRESRESTELPGLYFMGRLGELGGGPLSRNIPGAQAGAKRISASLAN